MSSFARDDRGVTEPYTDLPAVGLLVIGILLFGYQLCSAYSAYVSETCYADLKDDLRTMAVALAGDPALACEGVTAVLDAHKLDNMSVCNDFLRKYGRPGEVVAIEIVADGNRWTSGSAGKAAAGYILPVAVRLNDARSMAGTLTVSVTEGGR
jgi:hypothetical protein